MRQAVLPAIGQPGVANAAVADGGAVSAVVAMEVLEFAAGDIAVVARRGMAGLQLFRMDEAGGMTQLGQILDGPKTFLAGISDIASLAMGEDRLVLVASALENGLSSYRLSLIHI